MDISPHSRVPVFSAAFSIAVVIGVALNASSHGAEDQVERPNVIFFYADDLGYGDLACYGSEVAQTPRLDSLAREGTRFTQFYVSHCVCSPTRASAITGHFPGRHRIYGHIAFFEYNRRRKMPDWLDVAAPSLPRALQKAGYRTAMIGKWHLGGGSGRTFRIEDLRQPGRDTSQRPRKVVINHPDAPAVARYGFDHVRTTFGNSPTWKDAKPWPEPHETYPYASREWSTWSSRAIADETILFLKDHVSSTRDRPFYANVWFKDVHV
ncbi:MAG: sulfatase-like hydrolase/transferase, partial [Planctomycetes bacterium]|nr:sulfatase-like hydrolase/transferase [Planctomycetota bacterium]